MHRSFFGTDGIRTTVGKPPLTPSDLIQLGSTIAQWVLNKNLKTSNEKITIALAYDTRLSSSLLCSALQVGLLQHPIEIYDLGIMPTPALYYIITQKKMYNIGIMITASHNQYHDNGLKIITQTTGKLTSEDEQAITKLYYETQNIIDYDNLGTHKTDITSMHIYTQDLLEKFAANFLQNITIVLDSAYGAYSTSAPKLLEQLGAKVITLHTTPNGKNINYKAGSQYPEALQASVLAHNAHIGIAFDGDGDRVALVAQDGTIKDGDDIIALLLNHPAYNKQTTIVGTVMCNQGLEEHIKRLQKNFIRTPVGDKHVMHMMQEKNLLLGAEPSGHVLLGDFSGTSDGLFTALRVLEVITQSNNWQLQSFQKFSQWSVTIPVTTKQDLLQEPFCSIIQSYQQKLAQSACGGRIIVRYSGTEPILRVMVEGQDVHEASTIGAMLCQQLQKSLQ